MEKIKRPTVIIASIGRTGTKFFAYFFGEIFPKSTSLHEPDILKIKKSGGITKMFQQVNEAGFFNTIKNIFGKWNLIELSDDRLFGKISDEEAIKKILKQRARFIKSKKGGLYIESSAGCYGLTDLFDNVFEYTKSLYIIRDGRDWVKSAMNWDHLYKRKLFGKLRGHHWPEATDIKGDPYAEKWGEMNNFEKICWLWSTLNEFAIEKAKKSKNVRIEKFENIFSSDTKNNKIMEIVDFLNINKYPIDEKKIKQLLNNKKNHSHKKNINSWDDWTQEQKDKFTQICGPTMKKFGYF